MSVKLASERCTKIHQDFRMLNRFTHVLLYRAHRRPEQHRERAQYMSSHMGLHRGGITKVQEILSHISGVWDSMRIEFLGVSPV